MPWGFSTQVGLSEQAANVLLPAGGAGGLALGAWALNRAGMSSDHIARRTVAFFVITSSTNFVVAVLAGAALLLGVLPGGASTALAAVPAGLGEGGRPGLPRVPARRPGPGRHRRVRAPAPDAAARHARGGRLRGAGGAGPGARGAAARRGRARRGVARVWDNVRNVGHAAD